MEKFDCKYKNYLLNGIFSEPIISSNSYKRFNGNDVKGWVFNGGVIINNSKAWGYPVPYPCGSQACSIQGKGSIAQTFSVPKAGTYSLLVALVSRTCCDKSGIGNSLSIVLNGKEIKSILNPSDKKWAIELVDLVITNPSNNKLEIKGSSSTDRSTAIQLILRDNVNSTNTTNQIKPINTVNTNVNYKYGLGSAPVYVLGNYGIKPWGKNVNFPDQNAQWIWYSQYANTSAPNNSNSPVTIQYVWENKSGSDIDAMLNVIIDNQCEVFVNSQQIKSMDDKTLVGGGWGQGTSSWNKFICEIKPGSNLFEFRVLNNGGPGGLLVSATKSENNTSSNNNNNVIFNTNNNWRFIPMAYTPITSSTLSQSGLITTIDKSFPWGCLNINGVASQYVNIGKTISGMEGLSFGLWFRSNSNKNYTRILDFGNGKADNNICLYIYDNKIGFTIYLTNSVFDGHKLNLSPNINDNKWNHLVLTIKPENSGSKCLIYLNNKMVSSIQYVYPINMERKNCYLGKSNWDNDTNFSGAISNFVMYQKVLSEKEINGLYMSMINLMDPKLYIYLPFSTNSVLDTLLNNYAGKTFSLPITQSKVESENWTCIEDKTNKSNKWISVKMENSKPICMSMDGENCIEEETEKACKTRIANPIVPSNPIICEGAQMKLSWCETAQTHFNKLNQTESTELTKSTKSTESTKLTKSDINKTNGENKVLAEINKEGVPIMEVKPGLKALNALESNLNDTLIKFKEGGVKNTNQVLSITNMSDVEKLMVGGTFKLKVNLPMMPPYIKGKSFDISKGQEENYFYLAVEKLDKNCNIKAPNGNCIQTFADDKKCDNLALTSRSNLNTHRLVLVSSEYVLDSSVSIGKNSDFTFVKVNNQLYLINVQTGFSPSIYSNNETIPVYGDMEIKSNSNANKIYTQLNNILCDQEVPLLQTTGTTFVKCDIKKDPGTYLITTKNIGTSSPIRVNVNSDKTLSLNLLSFNMYGFPTNVYALTYCNFNIKTYAHIEKTKTPQGTFLLNMVCFEPTSNNKANSKNQLKFVVELVNFPKNFVKDNSIFDIN